MRSGRAAAGMTIFAMLCAPAAPAVHAREDLQTQPAATQASQDPKNGDSLPLAKCLEIALQKSRRRTASQFAIAIAEAQHRQASRPIGRR